MKAYFMRCRCGALRGVLAKQFSRQIVCIEGRHSTLVQHFSNRYISSAPVFVAAEHIDRVCVYQSDLQDVCPSAEGPCALFERFFGTQLTFTPSAQHLAEVVPSLMNAVPSYSPKQLATISKACDEVGFRHEPLLNAIFWKVLETPLTGGPADKKTDPVELAVATVDTFGVMCRMQLTSDMRQVAMALGRLVEAIPYLSITHVGRAMQSVASLNRRIITFAEAERLHPTAGVALFEPATVSTSAGPALLTSSAREEWVDRVQSSNHVNQSLSGADESVPVKQITAGETQQAVSTEGDALVALDNIFSSSPAPLSDTSSTTSLPTNNVGDLVSHTLPRGVPDCDTAMSHGDANLIDSFCDAAEARCCQILEHAARHNHEQRVVDRNEQDLQDDDIIKSSSQDGSLPENRLLWWEIEGEKEIDSRHQNYQNAQIILKHRRQKLTSGMTAALSIGSPLDMNAIQKFKPTTISSPILNQTSPASLPACQLRLPFQERRLFDGGESKPNQRHSRGEAMIVMDATDLARIVSSLATLGLRDTRELPQLLALQIKAMEETSICFRSIAPAMLTHIAIDALKFEVRFVDSLEHCFYGDQRDTNLGLPILKSLSRRFFDLLHPRHRRTLQNDPAAVVALRKLCEADPAVVSIAPTIWEVVRSVKITSRAARLSGALTLRKPDDFDLVAERANDKGRKESTNGRQNQKDRASGSSSAPSAYLHGERGLYKNGRMEGRLSLVKLSNDQLAKNAPELAPPRAQRIPKLVPGQKRTMTPKEKYASRKFFNKRRLQGGTPGRRNVYSNRQGKNIKRLDEQSTWSSWIRS